MLVSVDRVVNKSESEYEEHYDQWSRSCFQLFNQYQHFCKISHRITGSYFTARLVSLFSEIVKDSSFQTGRDTLLEVSLRALRHRMMTEAEGAVAIE